MKLLKNETVTLTENRYKEYLGLQLVVTLHRKDWRYWIYVYRGYSNFISWREVLVSLLWKSEKSSVRGHPLAYIYNITLQRPWKLLFTGLWFYGQYFSGTKCISLWFNLHEYEYWIILQCFIISIPKFFF